MNRLARASALAVLLVGAVVLGGPDRVGAEPRPDAHQCAPGDAVIGWDRLQNPIFELPDTAAKDVSLRWHGGRWNLLFSHISDDPFRFRLGSAFSDDLADWTPGPVIDQADTGGSASPDVTRSEDGELVVTYNSHTRDTGTNPNKLWYRTATDLGTLSAPRRLAPELFLDIDRVIDAAVAHTDHGLFLAYKSGEIVQVPMLAHSPSGSIEGPWQVVGPLASVGPAENFQFLPIDGSWHLLVTRIDPLRANGHIPVLYRLAVETPAPASWLVWTEVGTLAIPSEPWNTSSGEVANAAYLCDGRDVDGHWYLLYAGSTEVTRFEGRGHAKVGIARSTDLVTWRVPGASPEPTTATTPPTTPSATADQRSAVTGTAAPQASLPATGGRSGLLVGLVLGGVAAAVATGSARRVGCADRSIRSGRGGGGRGGDGGCRRSGGCRGVRRSGHRAGTRSGRRVRRYARRG